MSKIDPLSDVTTLANPASALATLAENNQKIEDAFANTLSRDGSAPNMMEADLDMNSHRLLNVAQPLSDTDGVNYGSLKALVDGYAADLVAQSTFAQWVASSYTAAPGQTEFPLAQPPASLASLDVSVNGATKLPSTDYALDGATLTFSSAMSGGEIVLVRYGVALPVGAVDGDAIPYVPPSTGIVGTVKGFLDALWATGTTAGAALVRFVQNAVGAVPRSVQDKLREQLSVKDFGAVGDGTADDTTAIQNAVNHVAGTLGRLSFPAGTYRITSPISVTGSCALVGDSRASSIIVADDCNALQVSVGNTTVEGLHFKTNVATRTAISCTGHQITLRNLAFSGVSEVLVDNMYWAKAIEALGMWYSTISYCSFRGGVPGGSGGPHRGKAIELNYSVNNMITHNRFGAVDYCVHLTGVADPINGNKCEGTSIVANNGAGLGYGVYGESGLFTAVSDNVWDYAYESGVVVAPGGQGHWVVSNNWISASGAGTGSPAAIVLGGNTGHRVIGNTVLASAPRNNIEALTSYTVVAHNYLQSGAWNIVAQGNYQAVVGNICATNGTGAINSTGAHSRVEGNVTVQGEAVTSGTGTRSDKDFYAITSTVSLTGGAASEDFNVAIPAGYFSTKPAVCLVQTASNNNYDFNYLFDSGSSTATNAVIRVRRHDGTNISAGTIRYLFVAFRASTALNP